MEIIEFIGILFVGFIFTLFLFEIIFGMMPGGDDEWK